MSSNMFESEIAVPRRSRVLLIVAAIFAVLVIGLMSVAGFITDRMWFGSVGATGVFDSILITKIGLFVFGALVSALVMTITMRLAYASRPAFRAPSDIPGIEQAQEALESLRKIGFIVVPVLVGLLSGLALSTDWQTWMMFRNGQSFGITDSVFNLDVSFFTFELPFWRMLQSFLMTILVISAIASAAVMYLSGSVRPNNQEGRPGLKMTDGARRQIAVFGGTFLLLQAWSLWLDRFDLVTKDDTLITGLTFVDANVNLPALNILTGVSVIVALLFFFNVIRTNWTLPILGSILLVLSSLLLGGAWPAFVQQVQVKPDQQAKETPFIQRNIESTRVAYDLDDVVYSSYDAVETPDANILKGDTKTLESIRLLDPSVVASTFEQLQQLKGFYGFADTLDVSRYSIDGEKRGTVMAVREVNLAGVPESQRNWVTDALIYTHGIGLAAAYDNTSTTDGQPAFIESDVPPKGVLGIKEPRIYFGEQSPVYSIVGGSTNIELDYPDDTSATGQQNTTYVGKGGVAIGGLVNKLLFAARFGEPNIVLSEQVTDSSRILYNREPAERVKALAPWLTLDGDPYPAVIDGRIVWILDGYTTSSKFPYSQFTTLDDAVTDSLGSRNSDAGRINYLRNSVKATVDAYDGTVTLYGWDETDPILKTWSAAFPELITSKSEMSPELLAQIRYPEDLFKVQRNILRKYHITDPGAFFTGENFWIIPNDPTATNATAPQPPYYLTLKMPGAKDPAFSLTTTFAPAKRPSLAAFMAVNSDPGPNYGRIEILQLPSQTTIPGPVQAQNIFESDATVSSALNLLRRGGSTTVQGNLLSLPVAGGVLYVQPVYVQSTGAGGYPLLRKVLAGFGQKVVMADTLESALNQVLGTDTNIDPGTPGEPVDPNQTARQKLVAALVAAQKAYDEGQAALRENDFTAYGAAQKRLAIALRQAAQAEAQLTAASTS